MLKRFVRTEGVAVCCCPPQRLMIVLCDEQEIREYLDNHPELSEKIVKAGVNYAVQNPDLVRKVRDWSLVVASLYSGGAI